MKLIFVKTFTTLLVCILFVGKCWTNFIYESQIEELRNSVKHLLNHNKNITTVPHDCTDRPFVEIDIVFKKESLNSTKYYAVFGNKRFFVQIEGISRDHLPVIRRDTQPMAVDSRFKKEMYGKSPISEYIFVGPLYLYRIPNEKGKYSMIGFNQVWLGCPQPMCLSPGFDGILSVSPLVGQSHHSRPRNSNMIIIFRGNYFWFYDFDVNKRPIHPPLTDMAVKIEDRWVDRGIIDYHSHSHRHYRRPQKKSAISNLNDSVVVPTYIDAVVPGVNKYNSCLYFFKNDQFVCYEWYSKLSTPMKIAEEWKTSDKTWKTSRIDAAFHIKSLIYFIVGDQLFCFTSDRYSCHSYPKNLKELHKDFPSNITTAFEHQNYIFVIKGIVYFKIAVQRFPMKINNEDMTGKYIFEDLLGCEEGMYTAWGFESYSYFMENFAKRMQSAVSFGRSQSQSHFRSTFFVISFSILVISSALLITVWYLRPNWMTKIIRILKCV